MERTEIVELIQRELGVMSKEREALEKALWVLTGEEAGEVEALTAREGKALGAVATLKVRRLSEAGRAKISAAARKRWAKARRAKKAKR